MQGCGGGGGGWVGGVCVRQGFLHGEISLVLVLKVFSEELLKCAQCFPAAF